LDEWRGYYTGRLQTSPTLGIVVSLIVIIAARTWFGNDAFDDWAWRNRRLHFASLNAGYGEARGA
jgi:hypothetical protein